MFFKKLQTQKYRNTRIFYFWTWFFVSFPLIFSPDYLGASFHIFIIFSQFSMAAVCAHCLWSLISYMHSYKLVIKYILPVIKITQSFLLSDLTM